MIDYDKERTQDIWFVISLYSVIAVLLIICGYFDAKTEVAANSMATITTSVLTDKLDAKNAELESVIEPEPIVDIMSFEASSPEIEIFVDETEATYIAKTIWGEARGCSKMEQAAVAWCILNRVDSDLPYIPNSIREVVTQKGQFHGYSKDFPVDDDIYDLAVDVIERWQREKLGEENVGRVLPKEYLYFYGDGERNHFTIEGKDKATWDWSLENPYE